MKKETFERLLESIRQMGRIRQGEKIPGTKVNYRLKPATPREVREVRTKILRLTQSSFARIVGESTSAVRHWEQGLRRPSGSATKLIRLLRKHPEQIVELS